MANSDMKGSGIAIASMNCRGSGNARKRRDVEYFKRSAFNVICLQDTHLTSKKETIMKTLWRGRAFFASYSNNARGVCILVKDEVNADVKVVEADDQGNLLAVTFKLEKQALTLINIYGPNCDDPGFYLALKKVVDDHQTSGEAVIICGDFNLAMDQAIDTHNYRQEYNRNAKGILRQLMSEHMLVDIWREMNQHKRQYTWFNGRLDKMARLDMFLISNSMIPLISYCEIKSTFRSDHAIITIGCDCLQERRGNGLWKFNLALLKETEYIEKIKTVIAKKKHLSISGSSVRRRLCSKPWGKCRVHN